MITHNACVTNLSVAACSGSRPAWRNRGRITGPHVSQEPREPLLPETQSFKKNGGDLTVPLQARCKLLILCCILLYTCGNAISHQPSIHVKELRGDGGGRFEDGGGWRRLTKYKLFRNVHFNFPLPDSPRTAVTHRRECGPLPHTAQEEGVTGKPQLRKEKVTLRQFASSLITPLTSVRTFLSEALLTLSRS